FHLWRRAIVGRQRSWPAARETVRRRQSWLAASDQGIGGIAERPMVRDERAGRSGRHPLVIWGLFAVEPCLVRLHLLQYNARAATIPSPCIGLAYRQWRCLSHMGEILALPGGFIA